MSQKHKMICIVCPTGCKLTVTQTSEGMYVEGALCKRGEVYGVKERTNPTRIVTSTVKIYGGELVRIPVRTESDVPKALILSCMMAINKVVLNAPVKMGDVVIKNILNTGVDLITSRSMKKK